MVRPPLTSAVLAVAAALLPLGAAGTAPARAEAAPDPCRAGHVALTFDDGPSSSVTPRMVATLRRLQVPATFFMVGSRVDGSPATARLVERSGFLVGNHSYAHEDMTHQSAGAIRGTIRKARAALDRAGVHPTDLVRPPYGAVDPHVLAAIRAEHDVPVLWNLDPRDWSGGSGAQIAGRFLAGLHAGDNVVVQHDGVANSPSTVAALPREVAGARRRGFCFTALDEQGRPGFLTPEASLAVAPADRHVREGDTLRITVTLAGEAGRDTSLRLRLQGRTASLADDLERPPSVLRFPAGTLSVAVDVPIAKDDLVEGSERFDLALSDGVGVRPAAGTTTIVIDDATH